MAAFYRSRTDRTAGTLHNRITASTTERAPRLVPLTPVLVCIALLSVGSRPSAECFVLPPCDALRHATFVFVADATSVRSSDIDPQQVRFKHVGAKAF